MRLESQNQLSRRSPKKRLSKQAQQALLRAYGLQPKEMRSCWFKSRTYPYFLLYQHLRQLWGSTLQWSRSFFLRLLR